MYINDIGFRIIPKIDWLELVDTYLLLVSAPMVVYGFYLDNTAQIFTKFFTVYGMTLILRSMVVFLTVYPDPRNSCQVVSENLLTTIQAHRCSDCMFSGHMIPLVLAALFWTHFYIGPKRILINSLAWLFSLVGGVLIIANRAHYTVDVVISIYVCCGAWIAHSYFFERPMYMMTMTNSSSELTHSPSEWTVQRLAASINV